MKRVTCPQCRGDFLAVAGKVGPVRCPKCPASLLIDSGGVRLAPADDPERATPVVRLGDTGKREAEFRPPEDGGGRRTVPRRPEPDPAGDPPPRSSGQWLAERPGLLIGASAGGTAVILLACLVAMALGGRPPGAADGAAAASRVALELDRSFAAEDSPASVSRTSSGQRAAPRPRPAGGSPAAERGASAVERVPPPAPPASGDPIQRALQSVAVVDCGSDGHGSGFLIAPGIVATNHHVVRDSVIADVRVTFPDNKSLEGRRLAVELLHEDPLNDLAFLAVKVTGPHLTIRPGYTHVNGQKIVAIGSPGAGKTGQILENFTSDGRLGPEHELPTGATFWSLSMTVNGGNSGGPVLDAQSADVLGVVAATFVGTEAQSLAVPHPSLTRGLEVARQATEEDRRRIASLHRQRYCLLKMARLLEVASRSLDRCREAALERVDEGGAAMNAAFNECKSVLTELFEEEFTHFETTVGGELETLAGDEFCEPRVRRGLQKLGQEIERQEESLRERVASDEVRRFIDGFEASLERSQALVKSVAKDLAVTTDEGGE